MDTILYLFDLHGPWAPGEEPMLYHNVSQPFLARGTLTWYIIYLAAPLASLIGIKIREM
jgi:hypothetical protein